MYRTKTFIEYLQQTGVMVKVSSLVDVVGDVHQLHCIVAIYIHINIAVRVISISCLQSLFPDCLKKGLLQQATRA